MIFNSLWQFSTLVYVKKNVSLEKWKIHLFWHFSTSFQPVPDLGKTEFYNSLLIYGAVLS